MLIDPVEYVAVPPAFVYGDTGLARETHGACLQLFGWLWVTRRSGKALRTSVAELAARWDIGERATYTRLQLIHDSGWLAIDVAHKRVIVRPGPRITAPAAAGRPSPPPAAPASVDLPASVVSVDLPASFASVASIDLPASFASNASVESPASTASTATPASTASPAAGRANSLTGRANSLTGRANSLTGRANSLHEPYNIFSEEEEESDLVLMDHSLLLLQNIAALQAAGVYDDIATRLARDPWVTPERIEHWRLDLLDKVAAGQVNSLPAVLVDSLRRHREPPAPGSDRRRYISGPYADIVQH